MTNLGPLPEPFPQEVIDLHLDDLHQQYEAGDGNAVLRAVRWCGVNQVPMPQWVVDGFHKATNEWYSYRARTLDEAFDVELPQGKHLNSAKKRRYLAPVVYNRVMQARNSGRSVDDELFAEVGRDLGLGKTLVKEYWRLWRG